MRRDNTISKRLSIIDTRKRQLSEMTDVDIHVSSLSERLFETVIVN